VARERSRSRGSRRHELVSELARRFGEHHLPIYASAIAFRAVIALIPLLLLGLGLLGALGLQDTWSNSIAPTIKPRVTEPVYEAINYSAEKILSSGTASLILFAAALVIWDLAVGVWAIMDALNRIHDVEESRSRTRRLLTAGGLAFAVGACVITAVLVVTVAPRAGGSLHLLLGLGRWIVAPLLLMLAVGLLVRLAPAEQPQGRWASVGSILVILVWIVASLLFKLWITTVASFKSPQGSLTGLLILTAYTFVSSAIFLVGAELDELLRKETGGEVPALADIGRTLLPRG
jgi:membrane protein